MRRWKLVRSLRGLRWLATVTGAIASAGFWYACAGVCLATAVWVDMPVTGRVMSALTSLVLFAFAVIETRDGRRQARRKLDETASGFEVGIGADGVRWRGLFGTRVLRWRDVERVSVTPGRFLTLTAHLVDGSVVRWRVADGVGLFDAARTALARFREGSAPMPAELAPPERDFAPWLDRLRTLLAATDYREKAITPEALLDVAEDPTAPPAVRVGSVLALSRAPDPVKARVRVAIADIADPEVADLMTEALTGTVSPKRIARLR